MHTLRIMDRSGDRTVTYDPVVEAETLLAKAAFDEARAQGHAAFSLNGSGDGVLIKEFDPNAETIVMHPQMVGG